MELADRIDAVPHTPGAKLSSSADIAAHGRAMGLRSLRVEEFHVLALNAKNVLIESRLCSRGTLTASLVHPREVFAPAMRAGAAAVVLLHNHPSGDPEPSPEDREVTRRLLAVGELVGVRLADHVIVATGGYASFLERGLL